MVRHTHIYANSNDTLNTNMVQLHSIRELQTEKKTSMLSFLFGIW